MEKFWTTFEKNHNGPLEFLKILRQNNKGRSLGNFYFFDLGEGAQCPNPGTALLLTLLKIQQITFCGSPGCVCWAYAKNWWYVCLFNASWICCLTIKKMFIVVKNDQQLKLTAVVDTFLKLPLIPSLRWSNDYNLLLLQLDWQNSESN